MYTVYVYEIANIDLDKETTSDEQQTIKRMR